MSGASLNLVNLFIISSLGKAGVQDILSPVEQPRVLSDETVEGASAFVS